MRARSLIRPLCVTALAALLCALGCASPPAATEGPASEGLAAAPDWVVTGCGRDRSAGEQLCGVGSASGPRDTSLLRRVALDRARGEVARRLSSGLRSLLEDYASTPEGTLALGRAAQGERRIAELSQKISELTLSGVEMADSWVSPYGTFYALVALDVDTFSERVRRMQPLSEPLRQAVARRAKAAFTDRDATHR